MARGLALAVLLVFVLAAPAQAASGTYTCLTLQTGLDQVQSGDVITLDGMCSDDYTLPDFGTPGMEGYKTWTLQGSGGDDGFDGTVPTGRVLTGNDVHNLTIQDLTFRDSDVTGNGGAIEVTGQSGLIIRRSTFLNNSATGKGGAVYVAPDTELSAGNLFGVVIDGSTFGSQSNPAEGNSAAAGGALAVATAGQGATSSYHDNFFYNNVASDNGGAFSWELPPGDTSGESFSVFNNTVIGNRASGSGGGGYVVQHGSMGVSNELYQGNSIDPNAGAPSVFDHFGGGLYIKHSGFSNQSNNRFRSNEIKASQGGEDLGGGGLAMVGGGGLLFVNSQLSRFESNTLPAAPTGFSSEGGGLFVEASGAAWYSFLDSFAGNTIGAGGEGGGIYVGAVIPTNTQLELGEVTVAGNSVGAGGAGAGIAGDADDKLIMRNSIVFNGPGDITGFSTFDIQYSDACHPNPAFGAAGNICADPKLVGGSDVHQTAQSPTIDKGNDPLSNAEGGERPPTDYEGDPRPTDGDGDGHTVDMGADESPAFVAQPPVSPPPPQCSDGADNDGDGAIDSADPGCLAGPTDNNEGDETERDLILCGQRTISLVRADVSGSKVVLSGIVASSLAGQKVQLSVRYLGRGGKPQKLGSVTPGADGRFQARVKKPSRKLFNVARYRAQVGSAKSVELKLPQSLASRSLKQVAGGMLELRGQVDRTVLGKRNAVVIKRILCGKYTTVGQARPNKKGAYVVRFPSPPSQGSALYRAETKVLARPGSKRYVKQFARAIGITF
jgi:hypothetical protein